ncbi:MerR family transcriptional regulator [Sanguibacter sp. 25GB23B1]|uniref:MerR family transcriptional regulator n=1 Tax=unclassified Sanguibacter TaxID=2645534 RepID=UPI0032AF1C0C
MRIAELAARARVKVSTVRFYERRGVLAAPSRTSSGYRDYDDAALRQLRFLRRGQELGFTLAELVEFTELSTGLRSGTVDARSVAVAARGKLDEIDARIVDLHRTRDAIEALLSQQCLDPSAPCPVVSALAAGTDHQADREAAVP